MCECAEWDYLSNDAYVFLSGFLNVVQCFGIACGCKYVIKL